MRIASVEHAEHQNERHLVRQWQVGTERDLNVLLGVDPAVGQPLEGRLLHQLHVAAVEERFGLPAEMATRKGMSLVYVQRSGEDLNGLKVLGGMKGVLNRGTRHWA